MELHTEPVPKVLELYLQISQYPILGHRIRQRMRRELFSRGVISEAQFAREVEEKAVLSQQREGISDPLNQETPQVWQERLAQIRDHLTDFYFAYNLPHAIFDDIVRSVLAERAPDQEVTLPFNPELAPWRMLINQAKEYWGLGPDRQQQVRHHLEEITVVLIKSMISDQIGFVRLAKDFLDIEDFERVGERRIGQGKIGGKAAGMLLAWKILQRQNADTAIDLSKQVVIPDSYFIGADVFYNFHAINRLDHFMNQKYKTQEQIQADYPQIQKAYDRAKFPDEVTGRLRRLLTEIGQTPLIVRSSSLLEDNFGFSFAGKYDSFFCPNQGSLEENLAALTGAIARIYASVLSPDALLYRQRMDLVDYDERMAILIQKVQGQRYHQYFFPTLAGVGFSRNPFRWNPKIRAEDGLLRMVWGLGTRAVDRVANDYPRMVALSHPRLRPEVGAEKIRKYSQHFIDLIDLEANTFETVRVDGILGPDYPNLRLLAVQDKGDYLQDIYAPGTLGEDERLIMTFDGLLKDPAFVTLMRTVLNKLEEHYDCPVDTEFTLEIRKEEPRYVLHLLQCRPQSSAEWDQSQHMPEQVPEADVIFSAHKLVPNGLIEDIRYVIYVDPAQYERVSDYETRLEIARVIGRLNQRLADECFILMGPGRWGSSNIKLGVKVTYADIYNTRALIEVAHAKAESAPELSYGTHFFQDLVETNIYPLPLYPDAPDTVFNRAFLESSPNALAELLPEDAAYARYVRVIDVPAVTGGKYLELVMDNEEDEALAYLKDAHEPQN
jgi:hypothetical protein